MRAFVNVALQLIGILLYFSCGHPLEFYSIFSTFNISILVKHLSILAVIEAVIQTEFCPGTYWMLICSPFGIICIAS
jgi:hypothetical protein